MRDEHMKIGELSMSKSGTRIILSFALALASGAFAFTGAANAQAQSALGYVASGENAGGSSFERGAQNRAPQAVAGQAFAFSPSADINNGAYTDPSPNVRASLKREHDWLSHPNAVRQPSAADRRSVAAQKLESFYASADPVFSSGKDLSISSQR